MVDEETSPDGVCKVAGACHPVKDVGLDMPPLHEPFFQRVQGDEPVDRHGACLADTVSTAGGLPSGAEFVLWFEDDHHRRAEKVQALTADDDLCDESGEAGCALEIVDLLGPSAVQDVSM
jgi:hypothetical protein